MDTLFRLAIGATSPFEFVNGRVALHERQVGAKASAESAADVV